MPWLPRPSGAKALLALLLAIGIIVGAAGRVNATAGQKNLQLEVFINGIPRNAIGTFVQLTDGRISATAQELTELGINAGGRRTVSELVLLEDIPSLRYGYDERTQKILITIDNSQRMSRDYNLRADSEMAAPSPASGFGGVLNYNFLSVCPKTY